jgi:hypothetical protein
MTTEQIKHIEFIQNVITRMNTNSFQIKEWTVTIISALLAIYASTKNSYFILAGIFPNTIFWFLDSFYLQQERKFRGLYNDVTGISDNPKNLKPFEMRPDLYIGGNYSFWNVFTSRTILKIYLSITIILLSLFIYLKIY